MSKIILFLINLIPITKVRRSIRKKYKDALNHKLYAQLECQILNCPNTEEEKMKITKNFLNFVEVEVSSFCNRQCWFCPNSVIDRHSDNILMPENTYLNLLNQLKQIDYDGIIAYSRYNEPMADKSLILKRIKQAREVLPNAFLYSHTNGDYLNHDYILELADAGMNLLAIQCYLEKDEIFNIEKVIKPKMEKIINRLGFDIEIDKNNTENCYSVLLKSPKLTKMHTVISATNFRKVGVNRGESIDTIDGVVRKKPCLSPFYRMYIDYDGSVMPCCQVRHDYPAHKHMILGNINNDNIFNIFLNNNYINMRKLLKKSEINIHPCKSCNATTCENVFDGYQQLIFPLLQKKRVRK